MCGTEGRARRGMVGEMVEMACDGVCKMAVRAQGNIGERMGIGWGPWICSTVSAGQSRRRSRAYRDEIINGSPADNHN